VTGTTLADDRAAASGPAPARPRHRARRWAALGALAAAGAAIVALAVVLSDNVVYFRTVSEALRERESLAGRRFRIAGQVVPGTITETPRGVTFALTDGSATVRVTHRGDPPQLFADDAPVVCEGAFAPRGMVFRSERIMIRHGNEYRPPEVDTGRAPPVAAEPGGAGRRR
jgi:cytochrome c-type biogenesis protein CcmE